jgi:hypothetical protein
MDVFHADLWPGGPRGQFPGACDRRPGREGDAHRTINGGSPFAVLSISLAYTYKPAFFPLGFAPKQSTCIVVEGTVIMEVLFSSPSKLYALSHRMFDTCMEY